jgi:hypothetical protein
MAIDCAFGRVQLFESDCLRRAEEGTSAGQDLALAVTGPLADNCWLLSTISELLTGMPLIQILKHKDYIG